MQAFDEFMDVVRKRMRERLPMGQCADARESEILILINEANEVLEGIDRSQHGTQDRENLCEELGDVLFQVALHSVIAQEEGLFTIEDVICRNFFENAVPPSEDLLSAGQRGGPRFPGRN